MTIPLKFPPNHLSSDRDSPQVFYPSGHCTALPPASSWAPPGLEKLLPQWTGKKWWQRSTRGLYLPFLCTMTQLGERGRGSRQREEGAHGDRSPVMPTSCSTGLFTGSVGRFLRARGCKSAWSVPSPAALGSRPNRFSAVINWRRARGTAAATVTLSTCVKCSRSAQRETLAAKVVQPPWGSGEEQQRPAQNKRRRKKKKEKTRQEVGPPTEWLDFCFYPPGARVCLRLSEMTRVL